MTHDGSYKKVPGQEARVRVILPFSSLSIRAKQVCVIPEVLLPLTARRMSPHLNKTIGGRINAEVMLMDLSGPDVC